MLPKNMSIEIKGYVRAEQQEEFEAWEKSEIARREKESNDAIQAMIKKRGHGYFPAGDEAEFAFRNSNAFNDY